jgi:putative PIN family toxin of toxin-antitoxin system
VRVRLREAKRLDRIDWCGGIVYDTKMSLPEIVVDTNVFVSALRSSRGASFRLLSIIDCGRFFVNASVPLILEYEEVSRRMLADTRLNERDLGAILDYYCQVAHRRPIYYLWRPFLRDPSDDMVLELAVAAGQASIITFNGGDFQGADQFGVRILTPREFLVEIGEIS